MRLFVAIELSPEVRRAVQKVQRALGAFDRAVRWTGAEQMHLTLKFLGEVGEGDVPRVTAALERATAGSERLRLTTAPAGCFPPRGRVRIVWVGLEGGAALLACQSAVEAALADEGFAKEERPYAPHLTIGRVREGQGREGRGRAAGGRGGEGADGLRERVQATAVPAVEQAAGAFVLMQSELQPGGAQHTRLATFALGA